MIFYKDVVLTVEAAEDLMARFEWVVEGCELLEVDRITLPSGEVVLGAYASLMVSDLEDQLYDQDPDELVDLDEDDDDFEEEAAQHSRSEGRGP